jgi:hypothetical protein
MPVAMNVSALLFADSFEPPTRLTFPLMSRIGGRCVETAATTSRWENVVQQAAEEETHDGIPCYGRCKR